MTNYDPEDMDLANALKREAHQAGWEPSTRYYSAYFTAKRGDDHLAVRVTAGKIDMSISTNWRDIDPITAIAEIQKERDDQ